MSSSVRQRFLPWALFLGLFAVGLGVAFWGLSQPVHAEKGGEPPAASVLARVGDTEITEGEVEEMVAAQLVKIRNDRFKALSQGLDGAVAERLVELEAAARGMTSEELMAAEVAAKTGDVTDEDVNAFYEERKAQIRLEKEQVADQIRNYLVQEKSTTRMQQFVAELEAKYGVQRYLLPPRIHVEADGFPSKGPADAPVTIVEFSDFECPYCSRVLPSLQKVVDNYGDSVRLVFRQFPLNSIHARAQKAAEASLCAADQEKFWEMHDAMFEEQKSLGVDQLKEKAARLGLDSESFNTCLDEDKYASQVAADLEAGQAAGVTGTPAMFVNGRFLNGAVPYEQLAEVVDEELSRQGGE